MKKTTRKFLLSVFVVLMVFTCALIMGESDIDVKLTDVSITTTASAATQGYYTYEVQNSTAKITRVDTKISGKVTVPSELGGYPVTGIGDYAFENCDAIISLTIPENVRTIGSYAFGYCDNLKSITINAPVEQISLGAFAWCGNLEAIVLPDTVETIGYWAIVGTKLEADEKNWENDALYIGSCLFYGTDTVGDYKIKEGTKVIAANAFKGNTNLTSVTMPNSVITIGDAAFADCSAIEKVKLSKGLKNIGESAFKSTKITEIEIPESVDYFHEIMLVACYKLNKIVFLNPETTIKIDKLSGAGSTFENAVIYGYDDSTAQEYASTTGRKFVSLGKYVPHTHSYTTTVTKAATCTQTGIKTYTCDCSDTYTETIAKLTHTYKTTTTKATLTKNGKKTTACTLCGKVKASSTISYPKTFTLSATSLTYNGKVRTPSVTVKDSAGKVLKKGTDYTVTYASGRKAVGTYKVTVKMIGNYSGTKTLSFKINPMNISKCSVKLSATSYTYNGKVRTPSVTITNPNGAKLTKDTHYTVTYSEGRKAPGTYKVTVKMKGNYTGTKTLSFKIKPISISDCKVKLSATVFTYDGKVKTPTVTVTNSYGTKLSRDTHYTVTYEMGRKNAGTYKVTVKMQGYYTGTKVLTFKINPIDISKCSVILMPTKLNYNGYINNPSITVKNPNGALLTEGKSYTATYESGRKNVGTYKVTVKMMGNYKGTKVLSFKINPQGTTISKLTAGRKSITVGINKKTTQTTGYEIQYSTLKNFTNPKTITVQNSMTQVTLSGLKSGQKYYVRVRTYKIANDAKYYSAWSDYKTIKAK